MEAKYGHLLDSVMHKHQHRVQARGDATTFLMPWESWLSELRRLEETEGEGGVPDVPRIGSELASVVQVLLKTSEPRNAADMKRFIHQANVRRHVVVNRIAEAKRRGHRAYARVDMGRVAQKAKQLPENDVPGDSVRLPPYDSHRDKMRIQKNATPIDTSKDTPGEAGMTLQRQRPNAVAKEKNSQPAVDASSIFENAMTYVVERVDIKGSAKLVVGASRKWTRAREEPEVAVWEGARSVLRDCCVKAACTFLDRGCGARVAASCREFWDDEGAPSDAFPRLSVLGGARDPSAVRCAVSTGSVMVDQFEP